MSKENTYSLGLILLRAGRVDNTSQPQDQRKFVPNFKSTSNCVPNLIQFNKDMNSIESQKSAFKYKYEAKNPLLVELTHWCLEPRYQNRPCFTDLTARISKRRQEDRDMLNGLRSSGVNHKSNINAKSTNSGNNGVKFGAQSNINTAGGKNLFLLKKNTQVESEVFPISETKTDEFSELYKKTPVSNPEDEREFHNGAEANNINMFQPQTNQMAEIDLGYEDDFKITPEIHKKTTNEINTNNFDQAFTLNDTIEPKINIISDEQPMNGNDYSRNEMPVSTSIKKKRKKKQIFDESIDYFYREPVKQKVISKRRANNIKKGNIMGNDKIFDYGNKTTQFEKKMKKKEVQKPEKKQRTVHLSIFDDPKTLMNYRSGN